MSRLSNRGQWDSFLNPLTYLPEAVLCGWARGLCENLVREIRRNNVKPSDKASPQVCTVHVAVCKCLCTSSHLKVAKGSQLDAPHVTLQVFSRPDVLGFGFRE